MGEQMLQRLLTIWRIKYGQPYRDTSLPFLEITVLSELGITFELFAPHNSRHLVASAGEKVIE
jgi:hypothetical protein